MIGGSTSKIHERALRIAYKDNCSNLEEILTKVNRISIHHKNVQLLATEIFKIQRNLNPSFMNQTFVEKDTPYTFCSGRDILAPKPNTIGYGIENAHFLAAKIWLTSSSKEFQILDSFRREIEGCQFKGPRSTSMLCGPRLLSLDNTAVRLAAEPSWHSGKLMIPPRTQPEFDTGQRHYIKHHFFFKPLLI